MIVMALLIEGINLVKPLALLANELEAVPNTTASINTMYGKKLLNIFNESHFIEKLTTSLIIFFNHFMAIKNFKIEKEFSFFVEDLFERTLKLDGYMTVA